MILVDSSIWIDHLRQPDDLLFGLLEQEAVLSHPFILGELAMGSLKDRAVVLERISLLPMAAVAEELEVLALVENHKIFGRGIGYIDAHLLAAVCLNTAREATLWTRDRRLQAMALQMGVSADLPRTRLQ